MGSKTVSLTPGLVGIVLAALAVLVVKQAPLTGAAIGIVGVALIAYTAIQILVELSRLR